MRSKENLKKFIVLACGTKGEVVDLGHKMEGVKPHFSGESFWLRNMWPMGWSSRHDANGLGRHFGSLPTLCACRLERSQRHICHISYLAAKC